MNVNNFVLQVNKKLTKIKIHINNIIKEKRCCQYP